ncbi:MAG: hypothetical protein GC202_12800 [Alphaproteobacteria bacterium]|nr:hypothetical protein [Alphaproteobacteria bacterium]
MSAIQQFAVDHLPIEDRLLLRVSAKGERESVRLLVTRRYLRLLWNSLAGEMRAAMADTKNPAARDFLLDMAETRATASADFSTPFREPVAVVEEAGHPPPPKPDPGPAASPPAPDPRAQVRLLWGMQVKRTPEGMNNIALMALDGTRVDVSLGDSGVFGLMKILRDAAARAEWDIEMAWAAGTPPQAKAAAAARRLN